MINHFFRALLLISFWGCGIFAYGQHVSQYIDYGANSQGLCDGVSVNANQLIADRTPTLDRVSIGPNIPIPVSCLSDINSKLLAEIDKYKVQDANNVQTIVNNYCSHMKGWVEYSPGTCSAGGPPPICPANHWYQDPSKSMDDYYRERNKIFNQRLSELEAKKATFMNEACSCWLSYLKTNGYMTLQKVNTTYQSDRSQYAPTNKVVIQCMNGACPVGFHCDKGFCVESSAMSNVRDNTTANYELQTKAKESVVDKAKDIVVDKVLDFAEKHFSDLVIIRSALGKVFNHPAVIVLKEVAKTTDMGTFSAMYQLELTKAQRNVTQLEVLYDQQRRFKKGMNLTTSNVEQRKAEIIKQRVELGREIFNLQNAADGIEREKELGSCNCYNVLNYQTQLVVAALNNIMNQEVEW